MFEVICIREVKSNSVGCAPIVVVGGKYTVVEVVSNPGESDYYVLAEDLADNCYKASLFARTNGPDECERLEVWKEEQAEVKAITDRGWERVKANLNLNV